MTDHDRSQPHDPTASGAAAPPSAGVRRPTLAAAAGAAALTTVSAIAVAGVALADRGHGWGGRGDRGWWGVWSALFLLAVVGATAALTALVLSRRAAVAVPGGAPTTLAGAPAPVPPMPPAPPSPLASAETILAERLARGEISPDDYRASVAALRAQPTDPPPPVEG